MTTEKNNHFRAWAAPWILNLITVASGIVVAVLLARAVCALYITKEVQFAVGLQPRSEDAMASAEHVWQAFRHSGLASGQVGNQEVLVPAAGYATKSGGESVFRGWCHSGAAVLQHPDLRRPPPLAETCRLWIGTNTRESSETNDVVLALGVESHQAAPGSGIGYGLLFRCRPSDASVANGGQSLTAEIWRLGRQGNRGQAEAMDLEVPFVVVTPPSWLGMVTISIKTDEEALANWFLEAIAHAEALREAADAGAHGQPESTESLRLDKRTTKQLVQLFSELIRYRFAGSENVNVASSEVDSRPRELASALRWPIWMVGSDAFATFILWAIYALGCMAGINACLRFLAGRHAVEHDASGFPNNQVWQAMDAAGKRDLQLDRQDSRGMLGRWIEYALPATGFVGTITGLGAAFGRSSIVSEITLTQRSSLIGVLLDLGTAFSTTFMALVIALPVTALFMAINSRETRLLEEADLDLKGGDSDAGGENGG